MHDFAGVNAVPAAADLIDARFAFVTKYALGDRCRSVGLGWHREAT